MNTMDRPWNKGLAVGQKRPLSIQQIRRVAESIEATENRRNLALFCLAIESMLRGVDLLRLRVSQVVDSKGSVSDLFSVIQRKTNRPVVVEIGVFTRDALQLWIAKSGKTGDDYLFTRLSGCGRSKPITTSHYRTLVKHWVSGIGLDPKHYSTHSLRRSKAALIYAATKDPEVVRILLGQASIATTALYLGIEVNRALEVASKIRIFPDGTITHTNPEN